jgi:hypothetical protein
MASLSICKDIYIFMRFVKHGPFPIKTVYIIMCYKSSRP